MKRRDFIRRLSYSSAGAMALGGVPLNAMQGNGLFQLAAASSTNDKVLVFIQLHGGNDALNTLVPISQYNEYVQLRPNLAIKQPTDDPLRGYKVLDPNLGDDYSVGVHPEMFAIKQMYDEGKVSIIQNVGYPDMNGSHFRGRDIVFMGGDNTSDYESGWMGRFLEHTYPGYPDAYPSDSMPDPLGIELSGTQSLAFHTETGIPNGLSFNSPQNFYELISSVGHYPDQPIVDPQIINPNSFAGDELRYMMEFEKKNNQYAPRLKSVYDKGSNSSVNYPESYPDYNELGPNKNTNPLSPQLRLIARLLSGGIKTKIFLVRLGGFDTHGNQVIDNNPSYGMHARLLYTLSMAVDAFYKDLKALGIDNRVLSMTFTEFGRRAYSNDSFGTDHGSSTPVMLFGTGLNAGVQGTNPDLTDLKGGNLKYNIDYRQIYTSVVQDWFGASDEAMIATGFNEWVDKKLDIVTSTKNIVDSTNTQKIVIYPNIVSANCNVKFNLEKAGTYSVFVYDIAGKKLIAQDAYGYFGNNTMQINTTKLNGGKYIVQVRSGKAVFTSSFIKK